jgi:hypothetical protein
MKLIMTGRPRGRAGRGGAGRGGAGRGGAGRGGAGRGRAGQGGAGRAVSTEASARRSPPHLLLAPDRPPPHPAAAQHTVVRCRPLHFRMNVMPRLPRPAALGHPALHVGLVMVVLVRAAGAVAAEDGVLRVVVAAGQATGRECVARGLKRSAGGLPAPSSWPALPLTHPTHPPTPTPPTGHHRGRCRPQRRRRGAAARRGGSPWAAGARAAARRR